MDTARRDRNPQYLSRLGSPRSPNQRKFSEALMHRKMPLPRGWKRCVRSSFLSDVILNLPDSTINLPFFKRPVSLGLLHQEPRNE